MKTFILTSGSLHSAASKITNGAISLVLIMGTLLFFAVPVQSGAQSTPVQQPITSPVPDDVQKAVSMPTSPARTLAFTNAEKAWAESNPRDAMVWTGQLPDRILARAGLDAIATVWVGNDEKAAADWGMNEAASMPQRSIFVALGAEYGQAAAEWVLQQPKHSIALFGPVIEGWCHQGAESPMVAANWLIKTNPSNEDMVAGLHPIVAGLAWNSPTDTADWLMKLPPEIPRIDAAENIANIWSRKSPADIPKIKEWVNQLQLPDEAKQEIMKGIVEPKK